MEGECTICGEAGNLEKASFIVGDSIDEGLICEACRTCEACGADLVIEEVDGGNQTFCSSNRSHGF